MNWTNKFFLIFFGFLTSCQTTSQPYRQVYIDLITQEVFSFAKEAKKSDGLYFFGYTGEFRKSLKSYGMACLSA